MERSPVRLLVHWLLRAAGLGALAAVLLFAGSPARPASTATPWVDTTAAAVQTFYRGGVPPLPQNEQFFPNGLYFVTGGTEDADAIGTLHAAGFTAALGSGQWDPSVYVDAARGTNIHIIVDQSQYAHGYTNPPTFDEDWFSRYANDPTVLGWLLYDEPVGVANYVCLVTPGCTGPDLTILDQLTSIYNAHAPLTDQLLFVDEQALVGDPNWTRSLTLGDAGASYRYPKYYPAGAQTLEPIASSVAAQTAALGETKASWFISQAFCCDGYGAYFPSPAKARGLAYAAIVHGATGLLQFGWDSQYARTLNGPTSGVIGIRPDTPTAYPSGMAATEDQAAQSRAFWNALDTRSGEDSLNRQLLALTEPLLSPTSSRPYSVAVGAQPVSQAPIRTMLKEYAGSLYLIAVNLDGAQVPARFTFDRTYHVRELFAGDAPLQTANEVTATFAPFDAKVYRLSTCLDPNGDGALTGQDVNHLLTARRAEAGFSPLYNVDIDYSGDGIIDWADAESFMQDIDAPLDGCQPCADSDGDGISDCTALFEQAALAQEPFLGQQQVVVAADRSVCSLLGPQKTAAGISGQDSGDELNVDGVSYWTFGDTLLTAGGALPNLIGWSNDADAGDCISLTPKTAKGTPALLLPTAPGELTVWPMGMARTGLTRVHFFYDSVVPDPTTGWRVAGVGLASFQTDTLSATRALGGQLLWSQQTGFPAFAVRTVADPTYVYALVTAQSHEGGNASDTYLARVPIGLIESPASYQYWQPGAGWIGGFWNSATASWSPSVADIEPLWTQPDGLNGVEAVYNPFLKSWLAVYTADGMTSVSARTAPNLTGPWDSPESTLVDCSRFHAPAAPGRFLCYSGSQHPFYTRDGGRTIYVTYANSQAYQSFLHEIRLAAPISQWTDGARQAIYLAGDTAGPAGFARDGVAFYASDIAAPGLTAIHRWQRIATGTVRYAAAAPEPTSDYQDQGLAFYAPLTEAAAEATNVPQAAVYRWTTDGLTRYSPLDLSSAGYDRQEVAFYAPCPDSDGDSLTDCQESFLHTDPHGVDSDGDGLQDGYERVTPGCDPMTYNDDLDGIIGTQEVLVGANPCVWDSGSYGCTHAPLHPPSCDVDTDGDGCMDAFELGPDPVRGGHRDPANPWDFYDVNHDGVITISDDILPVIASFGSSGSPHYSPQKDRSPPPSAAVEPDPSKREPWDLGPPDGGIGMSDVVAVVREFGHNCHPYP